MAAITWGTSAEFTFGGLDGLAAGSWAESAQLTVPTCHDLWIAGWAQFQATPADGEIFELYVVGVFDKANPTTTIGGSIGTGLDGTSSTETEGTAFMRENLSAADQIIISAATTVHHSRGFSLLSVLGAIPPYISLVAHNNTAAAMNATDGGDFWYTAISYGAP